MPIRVLLVDQDRRSRSAVAAALEAAGCDVVGQAVDAEEAALLVEQKQPTIALLDVATLGNNGAEVAGDLRSRSGFSLSVIAMADPSEADRVSELVAAGARGYVVKSKREDIIDAVRAVYSGSGLLSSEVTRPVLEEVARLHEREKLRNDELEGLVEQLQALSVTDWLTGLKNHGYFHGRLREELDRALRHRRPLALALADVDHLGRINDDYGHAVGDQVLQQVAGILQEEVRSVDVVCRVGGEEFALLLPETDAPGARLVAERIRSRCAETPVPDLGPVTVSIGVSAVPDHAVGRDELIESADRALYLAKREGKNRVRLAGEVVPLTSPVATIHPQGSQVIDLLIRVLRLRDADMAERALRTAEVAVALGARLELQASDLEHLRVAALLQDVGKIGVPDSVLYKPGPLTPQEWDMVMEHPRRGFELVQNLVHPVVAETVLANHERFDGTGYPNRQAGTEIPFLGRVLLVADAFTAMTSHRSYEEQLTPAEALDELQRNSGSQFDPTIVSAMLAMSEALELSAEADGAAVVDFSARAT